MQVVIFGATGGVGRQLVAQALAAGHQVSALVRRPDALGQQHERLRVITGDVRTPAHVAAAVAGQEVVLSALGRQGRAPALLCTEGIAQILAAMRQHAVRRILAVSAYGAGDSRRRDLYNLVLWLLKRENMLDKEQMELLLRQSTLDWTIVRPPALTSGPRTGRYRTGTGLRMSLAAHISRADVADFMLQQMSQDQYCRMAPAIVASNRPATER